MNPQGKGKIEWTDYTLNTVTGCKHGCQYGPRKKCYAHLIADRIYKEKFEPTFRPKRLNDRDLAKAPAGSKVFVCDMGDLFGDWVPDDWIIPTIEIVHAYPNLTFQFLTKNPKRYDEFEFPKNCWLGTTWDGLPFTQKNVAVLVDKVHIDCIKFVSFEPLLAPYNHSVSGLDWIIIGELTGQDIDSKKMGEITVWALELCVQAKELGIPVFVKNRLANIIKAREFPRT